MAKPMPPCYIDGQDCPRRQVGCRSNCVDWQAYQVAHELDMAQRKAKRHAEWEVNSVLATQGLRIQAKYRVDSNERYRGKKR